jgi:hypothetical protein
VYRSATALSQKEADLLRGFFAHVALPSVRRATVQAMAAGGVATVINHYAAMI